MNAVLGIAAGFKSNAVKPRERLRGIGLDLPAGASHYPVGKAT